MNRAERTIVGIAASTGGPRALDRVLSELPAGFPLPVLVVQHMARGFIEGLVEWLDSRLALPVALAEDRKPAEPGIWFAPDDAHLVVDSYRRLRLDRDRRDGPHRPSANLLLESIAATAGPGAVAVVLTGMGNDGARGVAAVAAAGGLTIAQDKLSSAVFGMPKVAAEQGAELVLGLEGIASTLSGLRSEDGA